MEINLRAGDLIVVFFLNLCASACLLRLGRNWLEVGIGLIDGEFGVPLDFGIVGGGAGLVRVDDGEVLREDTVVGNFLGVEVSGGIEAVHHSVIVLHAETESEMIKHFRFDNSFKIAVELQGAGVVRVVVVKGQSEFVLLVDEHGGDGVGLAETVVVASGESDGGEESGSEGLEHL